MTGSGVLTGDEVEAVTGLVAEAGRHALEWFRPTVNGRGGDLAVDNKADAAAGSGYDPVTEADRSVERRIRDGLAELFPEHAVTGEEFGSTGSGSHRWFVDPIDGTRAFITGQPMWGTLLGLVVDGHPAAGWMHLPVLDETYVGTGTGSHLVRRPMFADDAGFVDGRESFGLRTRATTVLDEAVVLCTHPEMFAPGPQQDGFGALAERVRMVRFGGDCMNYGLVASGDADLVVENQLAAYDIIPLIPIITGAGGVVTNLDGNLPLDGGFVVAAATRELHQAALTTLRKD